MNPKHAASLCLILVTGCLTEDEDPSTAQVVEEIRDPSLAGPFDLTGVVNVGNGCTGELISSNTVLTAAHCVCEGTSTTCASTVDVFFRPESATLVDALPVATGRKLRGRVRVHPSYAGSRPFDLATITLDASAPGFATPFTVAGTLAPTSADIMIAGFGKTGPSCSNDPNGTYPWLRWDLTHFDQYRVYPQANQSPLMQWNSIVWCNGDSGGAVLDVDDEDGLNPSVLTGIISGYYNNWLGDPAIDVAVATAPFRSWIKQPVCPSSLQNSCTTNGTLCDCTGSTNILWRNTTWGDVAIWTMDGGRATSAPTIQQGISSAWQIVGSGDFDGDRQADILWRYKQKLNSSVAIWKMNGTTHVSDTYLRDPGRWWNVSAVADFDGNGRADILWADPSTGEHRLWKNGDPTTTARVSYQNAGGNVETWWTARGAGDFNGDGKADIFWEDTSGNTAIWLMDGSSWIGDVTSGPRGGGITFQGIGDFNGDTRADVLWRAIDGSLSIWFNGVGVIANNGTTTKLNGPSWQNQYVTVPGSSPAEVRPAPVDTNWNIDRIADFNHDGRDDLLWRSGTAMSIWYLDGTRYVGEVDPRMPGETGPHWFDPSWVTAGVSRQPNF